MKNKTTSILLLVVTLSSILKITAQEKNADQKEANELVHQIVTELTKLPTTPPGISVAISKDNSIVYSEGFGYSDLKTKKKVTPKTQFRAGSLSRAITTTALAKLVEKKSINFNDLAQKYLSNYPKKEYQFTVKQLATGLSGLAHYSKNDQLENRYYTSVKDAVSVFSHIPLLHKPGDKYKYSIHAYTLLSLVMEKASNTDFLTLLDNEIFKPLKMTSTGIEPTKSITKLYNFDAKKEGAHFLEIEKPKNYSYSLAGASLISTPTDLIKLVNAYNNGYIKKDIVDTFYEVQKLNSGETIREGIGWDNNWDMVDRKVFEQDGAGEGTRSIVSSFPNQKISISLMTNALRLWAIEETAHTLAIPYLTKPMVYKQPKGKFKLIVEEDVRGKWVKRDGFLELDGKNDKLTINSKEKNEEIYKLIYLKRKNIYALIHPDGVLYTEIDFHNNTILGKVMYYRGPNIHKTSTEPPYLRFKSNLS
ncbi:serine hydrolase domain-containing protein [Tenacibaculum aiptasiae]|uniref:serine hydrolase domain-containing protein n=1 Tax=Tenacibaculum aiptasiae TaxID=426481 RepID=UPI00232C215D|nr:serine hydrolase domain-containing protein [Tenacibaculum aiptasiae]